jgi:uncharacterized protein (TIGR02757 family)
MGPSPAAFVRQFDVRRDAGAIASLGHRWIRGEDLIALVLVLQNLLTTGSIEAFFGVGYDPAARDVEQALEGFCERACTTDLRPAYGRRVENPGVRYFFPRPSRGSGCKRLNLFLRWMVRRDAVDLGVWSSIRPAQLVIPLDTHVIRVGQCLRLTTRRSPGWPMAAEITEALRRFDPVDPVRYDFALCHLGMMNACGFRRSQGNLDCPLKGLCRPGPGRAARTRAGSRAPSAPR